MDAIVEKLLAISIGASTLVGCRHVCHAPLRESNVTFAQLGDTAPQVAATTYAELGLHGGSRSPSMQECVAACGKGVSSCSVFVHFQGSEGQPYSSEGTVTCRFVGEETCHEDFDPLNLGSCPYGCGRLPAFVEARLRECHADPVAQHFAEIAMLEALSVGAFAQLARDLERLGIAADFSPRIAEARSDERRHARLARTILRRLGARPERVPRVPLRARSLEEVALDNAVEGCVRETFGAAMACVQASRARDPKMRAFFAAIAGDELRHAALSWDLHRVLMDRLPPSSRARIEAAQRVALAELEGGGGSHPRVRWCAGAPTRSERAALARTMAETLPYAEVA
ncbi:MAG: ferritin-like domain-containing protein [Polyangiales bacterium]